MCVLVNSKNNKFNQFCFFFISFCLFKAFPIKAGKREKLIKKKRRREDNNSNEHTRRRIFCAAATPVCAVFHFLHVSVAYYCSCFYKNRTEYPAKWR